MQTKLFRYTGEEILFIVRQYEQGVTVPQIAKKMERSDQGVYCKLEALKRSMSVEELQELENNHNYNRVRKGRKLRETTRKYTDEDIDFFVKQYRAGLTVRAIAKEMGRGEGTMANLLRKIRLSMTQEELIAFEKEHKEHFQGRNMS